MFTFKSPARVLGAVTLLILVLLLSASAVNLPSAQAETDDDLPLDHFWCYNTTAPAVNEVVDTQDQFDQGLVQITVGAPERFCNPVRKKHDGIVYQILDPDAHLVFYKIDTPQAITHKVKVTNQFGSKRLKVYTPPLYLAVPTQKNQQPAPQNLDHFKCYQVKGRPADAVVRLKDQFQRKGDRNVGDPVLLCNPTRKVHNGVVYEIQHPEAHLVCYSLQDEDFTQNLLATNQFVNQQALVASNPNLLCAPSEKQLIE